MYVLRSRCDKHIKVLSHFLEASHYLSHRGSGFWHVFGSHVANPTPQDLRLSGTVLIWDSEQLLKKHSVLVETNYDSETLKTRVLSNKICKQVLINCHFSYSCLQTKSKTAG